MDSENAPKRFYVEPLLIPDEEPELRTPVVHGLFRRGEVCNFIAAPKTGKTWMVYSMMLAIIQGKAWCGHRTEKGRVLLIDNELHPETAKNRLWKVCNQDGIDLDQVAEMVDVAFIRGRRGTVEDLEATMRTVEKGRYALVVIDAFYRFIGKGMDENSNADMTHLYNHMDMVAGIGDAALLLVHHASKGNQSSKETMDVGAGAGSIGRATDSHVVFLRHQKEGCVVMQAKTRSWQSPHPKVIHIDPPRVWHDQEGLDPSHLWFPPKQKVKQD